MVIYLLYSTFLIYIILNADKRIILLPAKKNNIRILRNKKMHIFALEVQNWMF